MGCNILRKLHVPLPGEGSPAPPELSPLRNEARLRNAGSCSLLSACTPSWCNGYTQVHLTTACPLSPSRGKPPCAPAEAPRFQRAIISGNINAALKLSQQQKLNNLNVWQFCCPAMDNSGYPAQQRCCQATSCCWERAAVMQA